MTQERTIFRVWGKRNGKPCALGTCFAVTSELVMTSLHVVRRETSEDTFELVPDLRLSHYENPDCKDTDATLEMLWPGVDVAKDHPHVAVLRVIDSGDCKPDLIPLRLCWGDVWEEGAAVKFYGCPTSTSQKLVDREGKMAAVPGKVGSVTTPPREDKDWNGLSGGPVLHCQVVIGVLKSHGGGWQDPESELLSKLPESELKSLRRHLPNRHGYAEHLTRLVGRDLNLFKPLNMGETCEDVADNLLALPLENALRRVDARGRDVRKEADAIIVRDVVLLLVAANHGFDVEGTVASHVWETTTRSPFAWESIASGVQGRGLNVELVASSGAVPTPQWMIPPPPDKVLTARGLCGFIQDHARLKAELGEARSQRTPKELSTHFHNRRHVDVEGNRAFWFAVIPAGCLMTEPQNDAGLLMTSLNDFPTLTFIVTHESGEQDEYLWHAWVRNALLLWNKKHDA